MYHVGMPTLRGPCTDCGDYVEKYVRPGKELRCTECAIARAARHNLTMHTGENPQLAKSVRAGKMVGRQIKRGEGEYYERWAGSMTNYVKSLSAMKAASGGSVMPSRPINGRGVKSGVKPNGRNERRSADPGNHLGQ